MNLSKITKKLLITEPYFGNFLLGINKYENKKIPTACVSLENINPCLHINPEFFESLKTDEERIAVLKHECLHLGYMHLLMISDFENKKLFNIAADIEINQYINNLPEGCIFIDDVEKELNIKLKRNAGTKYYYDALKKVQEKLIEDLLKKSKSADENGNIHPLWEEFEQLKDVEKAIVQSQIESQLIEAYNSTPESQRSQGNIPGDIYSHIQKLLNPPPPATDWKKVLRRFTGGSYEVYTKKTKRKESKRFSSQPGLKVKNKLRGLVSIDTSGSVNDQELKEFINQIDYITKTGTHVDLLQFDCKFQNCSKYQKNKSKVEIYGRGGTNFDVPIEYYNNNLNKYNFLVIFTDGEASLPTIKSKKPLMWVITSDGKMQDYQGIKIKINKNQ